MDWIDFMNKEANTDELGYNITTPLQYTKKIIMVNMIEKVIHNCSACACMQASRKNSAISST